MRGEAKKAWREKPETKARQKIHKRRHIEKIGIDEYRRRRRDAVRAKHHGKIQKKRGGQPRYSMKLSNSVYRKLAIAKLGGACERCGESSECVLEFDHRDRRTKKNRREGGDRIYKEVLAMNDARLKYALLCANCHRRKTRAEAGWTKKQEERIGDCSKSLTIIQLNLYGSS